MILKASQRSGTQQLAQHLLNAAQNEHVIVHELRGFMADDLKGALQEIQAQAQANKKIRKPLFSMSINPPIGKKATVADFEDAANRIETLLGLANQPRTLVFHEKEGRRHAHIVWSRVDENLKAIKLPFFKMKLTDLSRELYLEHGWDLPKGLQHNQERDVTNFDLAEWQAAKRQKLNPKELKAHLQTLWQQSHDLGSFQKTLSDNGFALAKGDKRVFVLVDSEGEVRSLSRALSIKAKEVKAKLGEGENLLSVEEAKTSFTQIQKTRMERLKSELDQRHKAQLLPIQSHIDGLAEKHRLEREKLSSFHTQRQQQERNTRQAQYQKGLKGLWHFVTGRYHKQKQIHEAQYQTSLERDTQEQEALIQRQLTAREALQHALDAMRERHQSERLDMLIQQYALQGQKLAQELKHEFEQSIAAHKIPSAKQHQPELEY